MRTIIALICVLALPVATFALDSNVVMTVSITNATALGRRAVVEVQTPANVVLSNKARLLALVGSERRNVRPDEFGPPQNFALRGTSHEVAPHRFRVSVALPAEKVKVRFILRDNGETLADEERSL